MWSCDPTLTNTVLQGSHAAGPLLLGTLQTFLAAQCLIAPDYVRRLGRNGLEGVANETYDFIVVGAGTAGSVVASRLAQDWKVLLLEAGGNPTLGTEIPQLFINNYGTFEDWGFRTEPQEHACLNYKEWRCYWPRGKVLGGTSSINGMYYIKGNKKDYDWENIGPEWAYDKIEHYFVKEKVGNNSIYVEKVTELHSIEAMLVNANIELGIPLLDDVNGNVQIGVGIAPTAIKDGVRQSSFNAYLKPIINIKNIRILTNVLVDEVVFDSDMKAVGVKFYDENDKSKLYEVKCSKEVILSAGTINSAHILLKSGIGPKNKSARYVKVDLPVGENLQDHIFAPIMFKILSKDESNTLANIFKSINEYILERKGALSSLSPQRVVSFINTIDTKSNEANIQNHFIVVYPNQSNFVDIFKQHKYSDQFYNSFNDLNKNHCIIIVYVTLLQPKSKGTIEIDNHKSVLIKPNYLTEEDDIHTLVEGMKRAIKLEDTKSFKEAGLKLHWIDIDECKGISKNSDKFYECIAKHLTGTLYHATGTVKLGNEEDKNAVLNDKLQVKFVKNLRIVDASVLPKIPRGNTMAAVLMIAEKAFDIIKADWS